MPGRIRRTHHWSKIAAVLVTVGVVLISWWLEGDQLQQPAWQLPQTPQQLPEQASFAEAEILRVVDGDTLMLKRGKVRLRLQGIDTPETVKDDTPVQPWGPEATAYTKQFLQAANWRVRLEVDGEKVDKFGRKLAFVWHDGRLLNEELVREGLARAKLYFDFSEAKKRRLKQAQQEAKAAKVGIWSGKNR